MVVHHRGEALQIVVAEEAVPVGATLHRQLDGIPGNGHRRAEPQPSQESQLPPVGDELTLTPGEQGDHQHEEHQAHRALGQHRQTQDQPDRHG